MIGPPNNPEVSKLKSIRAVTFDFWGTLCDNGPDLAPQYFQVLRAAFPGAPINSIRSAFDHAENLAGKVGRMGFRLSVAARVAVIMDQLGRSLDHDARDRLVIDLEELTLDRSPSLVEGARGVLEALSNEGYLLAIISDTGIAPGRVIRKLMAREGVAKFFQYWTFSDELGVTKRWRQPFLSTCAALSVAPEETLHVGDLPETDIRVAKDLGMRVALATYVSLRFDGAEHADIVLEHLHELVPALFRPEGKA